MSNWLKMIRVEFGFRRFEGAAIAGVIGVLAMLFASCSRIRNAEKNDPLVSVIGTKYVLQVDGYIVKYTHPRDGISGPMLTCNAGRPGLGSPELPVEVSAKYIGQTFGPVTIVGKIARGLILEIVGVKYLVSFEDKIPIFEVRVLGDNVRADDKTYDVIWLLDRRHPENGFDASIARRTQ
jgi:hypothetical protein